MNIKTERTDSFITHGGIKMLREADEYGYRIQDSAVDEIVFEEATSVNF